MLHAAWNLDASQAIISRANRDVRQVHSFRNPSLSKMTELQTTSPETGISAPRSMPSSILLSYD